MEDIVFTNGTTGYVTGFYVGVPHYTSVFKTTDSGSSWIETSLGTDQDLSGLFFTDELNGWAVGGDISSGTNLALIYRTTDGGDNWVEQDIPSFNAVSQVFFANATKGWAVGSLGTILTTESPVPVELTSFEASADNGSVFLKWKTVTEKNNSGFDVERKSGTDEGQNGNAGWVKIGFVEGQGTAAEENSYSFVDREVSSGQYGYRLKQVDFDGSFKYSDALQVSVSNPEKFSLEQNYPNPFNPVTQIEYSITDDVFVTLKVYNPLGEEVVSLVNGMVKAGSHRVTFDAAGMSSGVYYYRIEAGENTMVKKMILMR